MEKIFRRLELIFVLLFFTVGFLQYCSITYGKQIISFVQWPAILLGLAVLAYRVFRIRRFLQNKVIWCLVGFLVSYGISSLVQIQYGFYENARGFVFLLFEIAILFASDFFAEDEYFSYRNHICTRFYIGMTFLMSLASFLMLVFHVCRIIPQEAGPKLVIGFSWGRLFGAYWDPNIGSVMAVCSLLLSLHAFLFRSEKKEKIFHGVNCLIQLIYISFSGSRNGQLSLMVGVTLFSSFWIFGEFKNRFSENKRKGTCLAAILVVFTLISSALAPVVVKQTAIGVESLFLEEGEKSYFDDSEREGNILADISNRRFDIWKAAAEIAEEEPLFGASHFNILSYVRERLPESYLITNEHMEFSTMHNVLIDVLASQGILGLAIFLLAIAVSLVTLFKNRKKCFSKENHFENAMYFSLVVTVFFSSMFMTEIVYVISPMTLLFWISLGQIICDNKNVEV